jgi:predicted permease
VLGVLLAPPLVAVVARFAARFSVRALEVGVDATVLWVGAGLALVAAILLAYTPSLPGAVPATAAWWRWPRRSPGGGGTGFGLNSGGLRITPGTSRRLRAFATAQIAFTFVLLAGAGMLLAALVALQTAESGYDTRRVLAIDVPTSSIGVRNPQEMLAHEEMARRVAALPGVDGVALGSFVPWRDAGSFGPGFTFRAEGFTPAQGEEDPHARMRMVSPNFFAVLGVPLLAGRDFGADDRAGSAPVAIVSQSLAQRLFPGGDAVNRMIWWTDNLLTGGTPTRRRIVGVVADVDDENVVRGPALTIYQPVAQVNVAGRLFVHAAGDPYALAPAVTRVIRDSLANQPVERVATLEDVRTEVLAPERLNAFVLSGFAAVALLIAAVGVGGVLAFSVSARTREFGVRLAVGSTPGHLVLRVVAEGAAMVAVGIAAGVLSGVVLGRLAAGYLDQARGPVAWPLAAAAAVLGVAAVAASLLPAARAARVDVLQALRTE